MKCSVRRRHAFLLALVLFLCLFPANIRAEEPAVISVDVGAADTDTNYYAIRNNDVWLKRSDVIYELTGSTEKPICLWDSSLPDGIHVRLNNVSVTEFFYVTNVGAMIIEVPEGTVNSLGKIYRASNMDISGGGTLNCSQIDMYKEDGAKQHFSVSDTRINITLPAYSNEWFGAASLSGTARVTIQNLGEGAPLIIQSDGASLTMTDQAELRILQEGDSNCRTPGLQIDGPITLNDNSILEVHAKNNVRTENWAPAIEEHTSNNRWSLTVAEKAKLIATAGSDVNGTTGPALLYPNTVSNSGEIRSTMEAVMSISNTDTGHIYGDTASWYGSIKNNGSIEGNVEIFRTYKNNELINNGVIVGDAVLPAGLASWSGSGFIKKSDGSIESSTANTAVLHYKVATTGCTADTLTEGILAGYCACGSTVTLTFSVPTGKRLSGWETQPADLAIDDKFQFTMPQEHVTVKPLYDDLSRYTVAVQTTPADSGTVTGADTYYDGDSVTLSASPAEGFCFSHWIESGQTLSKDAEFSFMVNADRSLTAVFEAIPKRQISLLAEPADGGTLSGGGVYFDGKSVTVSAEPAEGFRFSHWSENGQRISQDTPLTFTASADRSLTAVFEAIPSERQISLLAEPANGGTLSGGGTCLDGDSITVSARPAEGFRFSHWAENGQSISQNASLTFTASADRTLTAVFERISETPTEPSAPAKRQISLLAEPAGSGTLSGGGTCLDGDSVTVSAEPAEGFRFSHWAENGQRISEDPSLTFTVSADRSLTAVFESISETPDTPTEPSTPAAKRQITLLAKPADGGTLFGGGSFSDGDSVTVSAEPAEGFRFSHWAENGQRISEDPSLTFTVSADRSLTAVFESISETPETPTEPSAPAKRQITLLAVPADGGTLSGGGTYRDGDFATVSAIPANGYRFSHWSENGKPLTTNASFLITVAGDRSLTAVFTRIPPSDNGDQNGGGNTGGNNGNNNNGNNNSGNTNANNNNNANHNSNTAGSRPAGAPATGDTAKIWPLLLMLSGSSFTLLLLYHLRKRRESSPE